MRRFSVVTVVCTLLAVMAGIPSRAQTTAPVPIEYWHVNTESFGGPAVRELVADFNRTHPGIVVSEHFQPNTYTGLLENLQAREAAHNPPDVAQIGYLYVDYVVKNLPFTPAAQLFEPRFLVNFAPNVLELARRNGTLVGMPYALSNIVTFYNADLLKAAGLDPNHPPRTWDDWRIVAPLIKQRTGKPALYIQVLDDNWSTQAMIESHGGRLFQCEGGIPRATFDSPQAAAAIGFWSEEVQGGNALDVLWNQGEQAFLAGQVATFVTTIAKRANLQKNAGFDLRAAPFPTFANLPPRLPAGGNALMVFSQSPQKQRAAATFIAYLESPRALAIWTKGTGYLPPNSGARAEPADFLASNPIERVAYDQLKDAVPWTSFPGKDGLAAQQALFGALQRSLAGSQPAGAALHDAALKVDGLLAGASCAR
jgi:multiple sugar transport system substrate-binding protein